MVDFVAVDFKPLKGGKPNEADLLAAEFTLYNMAVDNNLVTPIRKVGPYRREGNGVAYYTIEWHTADKQQAENASAEELTNNESPC